MSTITANRSHNFVKGYVERTLSSPDWAPISSVRGRLSQDPVIKALGRSHLRVVRRTGLLVFC
jgi:hypothetical protein